MNESSFHIGEMLIFQMDRDGKIQEPPEDFDTFTLNSIVARVSAVSPDEVSTIPIEGPTHPPVIIRKGDFGKIRFL